MEFDVVQARVDTALEALLLNDRYLFEYDLHEQCIAGRLALYLQSVFPSHFVDVEYNRAGLAPKRLGLSDECANARDENDEALVVPDIIVHRRGRDGPNVLVMELKKTTNPDDGGCDRQRVQAMRVQLGYQYGVLVQLETRRHQQAEANCIEWFHD